MAILSLASKSRICSFRSGQSCSLLAPEAQPGWASQRRKEGLLNTISLSSSSESPKPPPPAPSSPCLREKHPRPRPFPPTPLARCVWPPPSLEEKLQAATGTSAPLPRLAGPSVLWHHDRAGPDGPRRLGRRLRRESEPVPPEVQSPRARRLGSLRTFRVQRFGRSTPRPLRRGGQGVRAPPRWPVDSEFRGTARPLRP